MLISFKTLEEFEKLAVKAEHLGYRWPENTSLRLAMDEIEKTLESDNIAFLFLEDDCDERIVCWMTLGDVLRRRDYKTFSEFSSIHP